MQKMIGFVLVLMLLMLFGGVAIADVGCEKGGCVLHTLSVSVDVLGASQVASIKDLSVGDRSLMHENETGDGSIFIEKYKRAPDNVSAKSKGSSIGNPSFVVAARHLPDIGFNLRT